MRHTRAVGSASDGCQCRRVGVRKRGGGGSGRGTHISSMAHHMWARNSISTSTNTDSNKRCVGLTGEGGPRGVCVWGGGKEPEGWGVGFHGRSPGHRGHGCRAQHSDRPHANSCAPATAARLRRTANTQTAVVVGGGGDSATRHPPSGSPYEELPGSSTAEVKPTRPAMLRPTGTVVSENSCTAHENGGTTKRQGSRVQHRVRWQRRACREDRTRKTHGGTEGCGAALYYHGGGGGGGERVESGSARPDCSSRDTQSQTHTHTHTSWHTRGEGRA
jgi:hypothetical protein